MVRVAGVWSATVLAPALMETVVEVVSSTGLSADTVTVSFCANGHLDVDLGRIARGDLDAVPHVLLKAGLCRPEPINADRQLLEMII